MDSPREWVNASRMTTSNKLWIGFGTLIAVLVFICAAIITRLQIAERRVLSQADVSRPRSTATRQLEIGVMRFALALHTHFEMIGAKQRVNPADCIAEVDRQLSEYLRLALTEQQRAMGERLNGLWTEYRELGAKVLQFPARMPRRDELKRMYDLRTQIEFMLDKEMHPDAVAAFDARKVEAVRDLREVCGFAIVLLSLGVVVAVLTSWSVGRGIVKAERRALANAERLRLALEATSMGVWQIDYRTGKFTWSDRCRDIFGFPKDVELTREMLYKRIHPDDRELVAQAAADAMKRDGDGRFRIEHRIVAPNGEVRWVAARGRAEFSKHGNDGEPAIHTGVMVDVTERKRAEMELRESEARFRTLADNISQLAWMADANGWIFWYNKRWYEYTGMTPESQAGWGWQSVHDPEVLPEVMERWKHSLATHEPFDMIFPLKGADGVFRPFLTRVMPVKDDQGRVVRWFGTNTNFAEQQALEEALLDADRRKDEFLATLAHELRNPLAPLRNGLQLLSHADSNPVAAEQARAMMQRQLAQMVRLIDDLLDVSRISRGKIELQRNPVDLASVIQTAVETSRPLIDAAKHKLNVHLPRSPLIVDADSTRLSQVFANLLNNAAKFTPQGGKIEVVARGEWRVVREDGEKGLDDDDSTLSRTEGLAGGDGSGGSVLQSDEAISEGGNVRPDEPDSQGGGVGAREHRRRTGQTSYQGVSESSEHRTRVADGSRDPSSSEPSRRSTQRRDVEAAHADGGRRESDAERTPAGAGGKDLTRATRHGPRATFEAVVAVKDTGEGIPTAMLSRVFEIFTQVDRRLERPHGGLGIGLTLVKNLVEMHGGCVEAFSEGPNLGSTFIVRLPIVQNVPSQVASHSEDCIANGRTSSRRILIADDNTDAAESLAEVLALMGDDVRTASDGLQAIEQAEVFRPQIVLLDIGMPNMNGYDACRRLREQPWGAGLTIVAITGWGQDEDRRRSHEAGFDRHLVKPIAARKLVKTLAEIEVEKGSLTADSSRRN